MTVTVVVKDHGAKRARELLKKDRKELWVGVLQAQGAQQHPSGLTTGTIAAHMEFGTDVIPARSWLFDWLDENSKKIVQQLAADTYRVLFAVPPESETKALSKRGGVYKRQIQQRIAAVPPSWEPLKPNTIRKKGHPFPLIDTTTFINAIRYEVR